MKANYAEIFKIRNLEADFQQVLLVQVFWNFHNIIVKHHNLNSVKKSKKKKKKKKKKS